MRIILTHEQTDFDGIASILGAHLVDETALPVLPRRMNRNVKAFVTVYGSDLPFIDPRDIGEQPINYVYLVDTQSLTMERLAPCSSKSAAARMSRGVVRE
jgi:tRNA nucleotidyltransferase (CCA-adding enzyme)